MAEHAILDIQSGAGDTRKQAFEKTRDNQPIIIGHHFDTVFPTLNLYSGMLFANGANPADIQFYLRENGAWVAALIKHLCRQDFDFAKFQALQMRLQHMAAPPSVDPGEESRVLYNTARKVVQFMRDTGACYVGSLEAGTELVDVPCRIVRLDPVNDGGEVTVNGEKYVKLSAVGHRVAVVADLPASMSVDSVNWRLTADFVLENAATVGNQLDLTVDLASINPLTESVDKAISSGFATASHTIQAGEENAKRLIPVTASLPYNDATHPLSAGRRLLIQIGQTDATVASVLIKNATLHVPKFNIADHAA